MAEPDSLLLLRAAITASQPITFLNTDGQPTTSLSSASSLVVSGVTLPKSTPTRLRKPNHSATDPTKDPNDFLTLDAVYLAWALRDAQAGEYMRGVREGGVGITGMVAITEKAGVVEWLDGRVDTLGNIVPLPGQAGNTALAAAGEKRRYKPDQADAEAVKRIKQDEVELTDRNTVLRGSKQINFSSVRNLISERMKKLRDIQTGAAGGATTGSSSGTRTPESSRSPSKRPHRMNPIIIIPSSPTSLITLYNVKRFLEESIFEDPQSAKTRSMEDNRAREDVEIVYRKKTHIEAGGRESETQVKYFVVDGIEALNKFGADPWERVICVLTTGQAWQFKPYKWSEPRELFHRVKGFYISWTNDPPNPKVKDWNVTELKIDPNKRHLDKSTVAQFWKTLDHWVGASKPNLIV